MIKSKFKVRYDGEFTGILLGSYIEILERVHQQMKVIQVSKHCSNELLDKCCLCFEECLILLKPFASIIKSRKLDAVIAIALPKLLKIAEILERIDGEISNKIQWVCQQILSDYYPHGLQLVLFL